MEPLTREEPARNEETNPVEPRRALPSIRFPVAGNWLVLNPPGHPPHAYDISRSTRWPPHVRSTLADRGRTGPPRRDLRVADAGRGAGRGACGRGDRHRRPDAPQPSRRPIGVTPIRPARATGDLAQLAGNHVIIESGGLDVVLAHPRRGSLAVREGERIELGQPLGVIGNSENILAPHLHLHVMDGPNFCSARVVPFRVDLIRRMAPSPMGTHAQRAAASPPRSNPSHADRPKSTE